MTITSLSLSLSEFSDNLFRAQFQHVNNLHWHISISYLLFGKANTLLNVHVNVGRGTLADAPIPVALAEHLISEPFINSPGLL